MTIAPGSTNNTLLAVVFNDDGSVKTDLAFDTAGISIYVQRIGQADSSPLTLSAKVGTTWAAGAFKNLANGDISVDVADAFFTGFTGQMRIVGSFTGGTIVGYLYDVGYPQTDVRLVLGGTAVINTDVAKESSVQLLLTRVTEAAGDLWVRLATMIENVGGWRWTAKAVEEVSGVGAGSIKIPFKFQLADTTGVASVKVSIPGTGAINYSGTDGTTFLMVDPSATYSVRVTPPAAYQAVADFNVVVGLTDPSEQVVTLVSNIPAADNPGSSMLVIMCVDRQGAPEAGVIIHGRVERQGSGIGVAYDGSKQQSDPSGTDGIATLEVPRLTKYQIRRGDSPQWTTVDVGDNPTTVVPSFVGAP